MLMFLQAPGGRKRLSLIQMVLLTHLKAGSGYKRASNHSPHFPVNPVMTKMN